MARFVAQRPQPSEAVPARDRVPDLVRGQAPAMVLAGRNGSEYLDRIRQARSAQVCSPVWQAKRDHVRTTTSARTTASHHASCSSRPDRSVTPSRSREDAKTGQRPSWIMNVHPSVAVSPALRPLRMSLSPSESPVYEICIDIQNWRCRCRDVAYRVPSRASNGGRQTATFATRRRRTR
jgi:hypothetical protein